MSDGTALVLVVDDNEMNRDMLSRRLRRQDYEVELAEDGEQALAMVQQRTYDLVLLDIMMPKLSGYEVLARIKADERTRHIPVIMISAVDELESVVKCIELGAEDYLFKPFNPVLLKARVHASLSKNIGSKSAALTPQLQAIGHRLSRLLEDAEMSDTLKAELSSIQAHLAELEHSLTG